MRVKPYAPLTSDDLVDDPAQYAQENGLVDNHDNWVRGVIGAWRWVALEIFRERILELVKDKYVIDLGGSAAPLGYGALVVDYWAQHRSLWDLPPHADVVFASHVLEHFVDIDNALVAIADKIRTGGHIIVHVPSYMNEMLRSDNWEVHEQTFCLAGESTEFTPIDTLLERWFDIEEATDVGRNIFIIGRKR